MIKMRWNEEDEVFEVENGGGILAMEVCGKKRENGEKENEDKMESEGMRCKRVIRVYIGGLALRLITNEM